MVSSVYDGDTASIEGDIGGQYLPLKLRFLYIDTPELRGNKHGPAMPEGKQAAEYLKELMPVGSKVKLWAPGEKLKTDGYGRILAVVILPDGTTAQERMIAAGWTPLWEKYGEADPRWRNSLQSAENQAKAEGAGAWGTARKYMQDKANETTPKRYTLQSAWTASAGRLVDRTNAG
jgi:endonuclease YncB( thermonuclease family)